MRNFFHVRFLSYTPVENIPPAEQFIYSDIEYFQSLVDTLDFTNNSIPGLLSSISSGQ